MIPSVLRQELKLLIDDFGPAAELPRSAREYYSFIFEQRLAQGNPVDLEQLALLEQQLRRLKQAGIATRSEYSLQRPLGRLVQVESPGKLANAGGLAQR